MKGRTAKETMNLVKWQSVEWEKPFVSYTSGKYICMPKPNTQKSNFSDKWIEELNNQFSKDEAKMASKHFKIFSTNVLVV